MIENETVIDIYSAMGKFSRRQIDYIFLTFPRKQDLTVHAKWDNFHEMPNPVFW